MFLNICRTFCALLIILTISGLIFAQDYRGKVQGTISDDAGAAIPGVKVILHNDKTGVEVSTIATEERFDSTTSHTVLGVPVGKTVAQIRVPAVYRYHIPLQTEWKIRVLGETLVVVAPKVQASLPVAVDTGKLETFTSGLWSPITGTDAVAALQKSITSTLGKKAASEQLVLLQRESARRTVSEFVQKWVVSQSRWKNGKAPTVLVFFEDEPLGKKAVPLVASPPQ